MYLKSIQYSIICGVLGIASVGCGQDDTPENTQSSITTTGSTSVTTTTGTSTATTTGTSTATTTGTSTATSTTIDTTNLYGTAPAQAVPAPQFTVYSHEDETRTREDLIGHPTVGWFFPFADTPG